MIHGFTLYKPSPGTLSPASWLEYISTKHFKWLVYSSCCLVLSFSHYSSLSLSLTMRRMPTTCCNGLVSAISPVDQISSQVSCRYGCAHLCVTVTLSYVRQNLSFQWRGVERQSAPLRHQRHKLEKAGVVVWSNLASFSLSIKSGFYCLRGCSSNTRIYPSNRACRLRCYLRFSEILRLGICTWSLRVYWTRAREFLSYKAQLNVLGCGMSPWFIR